MSINIDLIPGIMYAVSYKIRAGRNITNTATRHMIFVKKTNDGKLDFKTKDGTHEYFNPRNITSISTLDDSAK